jgi:hypothetical protein
MPLYRLDGFGFVRASSAMGRFFDCLSTKTATQAQGKKKRQYNKIRKVFLVG